MSAPIGATFVIPLENGQYAAARVLDNEGGVTFVVLDGFWGAVPTADEIAGRGLHPLPYGRTDPLLRDNVWKGWFEEELPESFRIVARAPLTAQERAMGYEGTMVFQDPGRLAATLYAQWRWMFDRETLEQEWNRTAAAAEERSRARREGLTLEGMRDERPFSSWTARCGAEVVGRLQRIFRVAAEQLIAVGEGGDQESCAAVLEGVIDALNELDGSRGFIESVERDALVERIEELASLVGLDNRDERLTAHRDW